MKHLTSRDVEGSFNDVAVRLQATGIVPKGTPLIQLRDGIGTLPYAVASETLVAQITGNPHDAKYRWLYVPADAVDEVQS